MIVYDCMMPSRQSHLVAICQVFVAIGSICFYFARGQRLCVIPVACGFQVLSTRKSPTGRSPDWCSVRVASHCSGVVRTQDCTRLVLGAPPHSPRRPANNASRSARHLEFRLWKCMPQFGRSTVTAVFELIGVKNCYDRVQFWCI